MNGILKTLNVDLILCTKCEVTVRRLENDSLFRLDNWTCLGQRLDLEVFYGSMPCATLTECVFF